MFTIIGKNSPGDMTSMVEAMLPMFTKYNVDMYFAGHDHRLEVRLISMHRNVFNALITDIFAMNYSICNTLPPAATPWTS